MFWENLLPLSYSLSLPLTSHFFILLPEWVMRVAERWRGRERITFGFMSDNHCWAKGLLLPLPLSLLTLSLPLFSQQTLSNDRHITDVIPGNFYCVLLPSISVIGTCFRSLSYSLLTQVFPSLPLSLSTIFYRFMQYWEQILTVVAYLYELPVVVIKMLGSWLEIEYLSK